MDCVGLVGLPLDPDDTTGGKLPGEVRPGLDVLGDQAEWLLFILSVEVCEPFVDSAFELEGRLPDFPKLVLLNSSSIDLCLIFFASWLLLLPPPRGLVILTGEPLMLTNTFVLPTDLFLGGFGPAKPAAGKELEIPPPE